jgi:hypothetical protein
LVRHCTLACGLRSIAMTLPPFCFRRCVSLPLFWLAAVSPLSLGGQPAADFP